MSVSTLPYNDRRVQYEASEGQLDFWFDFPLARALDLSVTRQRGGVLEALSQERDYSVSSFGDNGGTITLSQGAQDGDVLELFGDRSIERATQFSLRGDFSSKAVNDELNHIYIILQELKEQHEGLVHLPANSQPVAFSEGLTVLGQDSLGRTVRLDMASFRGEKGDKGDVGLTGARGSVPSVIAESQSGCVVGNIDGGYFGENYPCQDAAVFSLANVPQSGVLGWANNDFQVLGLDEFKGEPGAPGQDGATGPIGPTGVVPSVIAEAANGAYIGNIDGGYFGQPGGNISGNIFSLQAAPGVMGFDEDGKAKLFGYGEFKGETGAAGAAGPTGPIGPTGSLPSVIAEAANGAVLGNIDGGYFGETASASGALFSSVRAENISYSSTTVKAALDALDAGKQGRSDPVDAGTFDEVAASAETKILISDETIDGGLF